MEPINVIREEVPRTRPDRLSGSVSAQGESATGGVAAGAAVSAWLRGPSISSQLASGTSSSASRRRP